MAARQECLGEDRRAEHSSTNRRAPAKEIAGGGRDRIHRSPEDGRVLCKWAGNKRLGFADGTDLRDDDAQMDTDNGLIEFFLKPQSYPHITSAVTHIQTHISHVFIGECGLKHAKIDRSFLIRQKGDVLPVLLRNPAESGNSQEFFW